MIKRCLTALLLMLLIAPVFAGQAFTYKDTAGKQHSLSDFKGKWVLVNYWATWCPPCLEEIPDLVSIYDQRKDKDIMVIGVAIDYKNPKQVADFVDDMLMSYPIVLGDDKTVAQLGAAEVLPTTYIFNPQGKLVVTKHGLITRQYIDKLIAGN
ncbi:MAG TPA: TlpA disulfide reductase family protein [Methylophilaceae bacterium]|jgi:thiol-disulfide isomerase/thioredoxin